MSISVSETNDAAPSSKAGLRAALRGYAEPARAAAPAKKSVAKSVAKKSVAKSSAKTGSRSSAAVSKKSAAKNK